MNDIVTTDMATDVTARVLCALLVIFFVFDYIRLRLRVKTVEEKGWDE